ncbi:unnamed protein product [Callosobruchus maculatus]|uniref:Uncharacterized protein n=1 Tax=Callosobruchus maculatus TaxID=64391 RepID=A0A653CJI6_CALMS|nr:unnamed protein product [Callosobruchus maculatus]
MKHMLFVLILAVSYLELSAALDSCHNACPFGSYCRDGVCILPLRPRPRPTTLPPETEPPETEPPETEPPETEPPETEPPETEPPETEPPETEPPETEPPETEPPETEPPETEPTDSEEVTTDASNPWTLIPVHEIPTLFP